MGEKRLVKQKIVTTHGSLSITLVLLHPGCDGGPEVVENFSLFIHFCK